MSRSYPLLDDYVAHEVAEDEFTPVLDDLRPQVFDDLIELPWRSMMSPDAQAARDGLRANLGSPFRLNWVIRHRDQIVGWTTGVQQTSERYAMSNSAILPEHRNRGVYSALLPVLLQRLRREGFQTVLSHHHATNSAVIVPKLKAGFVLSGTEVSEIYGLLVTMTYFFDPRRREAFDFRVGRRPASRDVLDALGYAPKPSTVE